MSVCSACSTWDYLVRRSLFYRQSTRTVFITNSSAWDHLILLQLSEHIDLAALESLFHCFPRQIVAGALPDTSVDNTVEDHLCFVTGQLPCYTPCPGSC